MERREPRFVYIQDGGRRTAGVALGEKDGLVWCLVRNQLKRILPGCVGTRQIRNREVVMRLRGWYEVYIKLAAPTGRLIRGGGAE